MPRRTRMYIPNLPYHIVQRGNKVRCHAYRELFKYQLSEHDIHIIEKAEEYCQPVGDDRFKKELEEKYGVKHGQMSSGRPRKIVG